MYLIFYQVTQRNLDCGDLYINCGCHGYLFLSFLSVIIVVVVVVASAVGGEIVTFFPLQVALHFNAYFSPLWFLSSLVAQFYKVSFS